MEATDITGMYRAIVEDYLKRTGDQQLYGDIQGRQTGGGGWGLSTPPEFWMGGLNTCQPPPDFEKKFFRGGLAPLKLI